MEQLHVRPRISGASTKTLPVAIFGFVGYASIERLALEGAFEDQTDETILLTVIREGCIGETVAALEAAEALEHAVDPAVREVLTTIAEDERQHALLAWRYVAWAIAQGGESLRSLLAAELVERLVEPASRCALDEADQVIHGVVGEGRRAEIRRQALEKAIGPCARALLGGRSPRAPVGHDRIGAKRARIPDGLLRAASG